MLKLVKACFFILASIIMALCLILAPNSSGPVSVSFTGVLSIYLGMDVAGMITRTASMEVGEYKKLHTHKYVISSACLASLIIISVYVQETVDVTTAMSSFMAAIMIVIGCLLGGLEGNKLATYRGKE